AIYGAGGIALLQQFRLPAGEKGGVQIAVLRQVFPQLGEVAAVGADCPLCPPMLPQVFQKTQFQLVCQ
ncbi:hypothetical protein EJMLMN_EJMLMN_04325, partial [Dysosmobacter welbionis]